MKKQEYARGTRTYSCASLLDSGMAASISESAAIRYEMALGYIYVYQVGSAAQFYFIQYLSAKSDHTHKNSHRIFSYPCDYSSFSKPDAIAVKGWSEK